MSTSMLPAGELRLLQEVFRRHPRIREVQIFGSRAKGTHAPFSDVDLAVTGELDELQAKGLEAELDELPLPYRFDVIALSTLRHEELREHIQRVGRSIYIARE